MFKFKCSCALVTKWQEVIPLPDTSASCKQENLYTTLDIKVVRVLDFNRKFDPVFKVLQNTAELKVLMSALNLS